MFRYLFIPLLFLVSTTFAQPNLIYAVATFQAAPGQQEALAEQMSELVTQTYALDGPTVYEAYQSVDDSARFVAFEAWPDQETLEAHLSAEHFTSAIDAMGASMAAPLEGRVYRRVEPASGGEVTLPPTSATENAPLIYAVATFQANPGQADMLAERIADLVTQTRERDNPVVYEAYQATDDPTLFVAFEAWPDQQTLEAHLSAEHFTSFIEAITPLMVAPLEGGVYQRVEAAPVEE